MFLTKKHLSRRTVLKGAGASIALPLLDAMIPAHTALASTAAAPKSRLGFVYFPHGAVQQFWTPKGTGRDFQFSPILKPLEPLRDYVTVVSGTRNKGGESSDPHGIIEMTWLSCVGPGGRDAASDRGVSADQLAARHIGQDTPLPSLEICGEPGGYSSLSWRTPSQQLPMEGNPRKIFYQMFGAGDTNEERRGILNDTGSLLDYVQDATASLNRKLDASDRALVGDYLDSVREIERRVQKLKVASESFGNLPNAPLGAPEDFTELLDVQFEMMALAWQTNQTRVITYRLAKEATMRSYTMVNVTEAFHPLSHHGEDPDKLQRLVRIQAYHSERMAKFAQRLKSIKEGDGTLLDSVAILYGSNMANSDRHNNDPLPSTLIGRACGKIKGGQHLHFPQDTPHSSLLVTLLQRVGAPVEKIADSNGPLADV
ncbi:MAG TPA: DUF1552 domain-containing protein [Steroidobacteraceae bacterium]|nr:DUF1552 domain-containing protein [Steroidobacteraceae bacterium]